jgi:hypothetical protein
MDGHGVGDNGYTVNLLTDETPSTNHQLAFHPVVGVYQKDPFLRDLPPTRQGETENDWVSFLLVGR